MKQIKNGIKAWMFWFLIFCACSLQAQIPDYVQGDVNYTQTLAFHKVDTLLVVLPHNYKITDQEKIDIESYVFWEQHQKKPFYTYKTEMELTQKDQSGNIQFYGPFCDFQSEEIQKIPIKQVDGGFMFNKEVFSSPTDAFFYINDEATRLYTCRNSTQVLHQYANLAAGYFPFYIFRGKELYLSGYCSNTTQESRINYIMKMRQAYFKKVATRHFDFYLTKPIYNDSLRQVILGQVDKNLEKLCEILNTDTLNLGRMTTYVYNSMVDLQQFLSMSPQMTIYGKSIGNVNHVSTFDMSVFNHELAHTVIGHKVGSQSSFFCEGFAVYTGYLMEDSNYENDLDSTKTQLDLLTEDMITGPDYRFFSLPPMYAISGVFTRFIIDKIGIETFKTIYAQQNIENAFLENGLPLVDLITEFKHKCYGN